MTTCPECTGLLAIETVRGAKLLDTTAIEIDVLYCTSCLWMTVIDFNRLGQEGLCKATSQMVDAALEWRKAVGKE